jgi:hypothetical protein
LFVIADGPRQHRDGEAALCAEAREITEHVDWDCEVMRNYADKNLGNYRRVPSGQYCDELLERYRHDTRIMHIAGNHLQPETRREVPYSYTFARWNIVWGWATWRRAWQHFDVGVPAWGRLRTTSFLHDLMGDAMAVQEYRRIFDELYDRPGEVDGWDHAWSFACWSQSGFTLMPATTLVGNVGFGPDATHFPSKPDDPRGRLSPAPMAFPLTHPSCLVQDSSADEFIIRNYVIQPQPSPLGRLYMFADRTASKLVRNLAGMARRARQAVLGKASLFVTLSGMAVP